MSAGRRPAHLPAKPVGQKPPPLPSTTTVHPQPLAPHRPAGPWQQQQQHHLPYHQGGTHASTSRLVTPCRIPTNTYYDSEHTVPSTSDLHALLASLTAGADSASFRRNTASLRHLALEQHAQAQRTGSISSNGNGNSNSVAGQRYINHTAGAGNGTKRAGTPLSQGYTAASAAANNASRGVKRSRFDSESSLSPASSTSSSIDFSGTTTTTNASNNPQATATAAAGAPSNGHDTNGNGVDSRASSPSIPISTAGTGNALGLGLGIGPAKGRAAKDPSTSSSTSTSTSVSVSVPSTTSTAPLIIPGVSGPAPALPGFKKKARDIGEGGGSTDSSAGSRGTSPSDPLLHRRRESSASTSTSTLPPAPASLPAKPGTLPPKPASSSSSAPTLTSNPIPASSGPLHTRRESSTRTAERDGRAGTPLDKDRDRDRDESRSSKESRRDPAAAAGRGQTPQQQGSPLLQQQQQQQHTFPTPAGSSTLAPPPEVSVSSPPSETDTASSAKENRKARIKDYAIGADGPTVGEVTKAEDARDGNTKSGRALSSTASAGGGLAKPTSSDSLPSKGASVSPRPVARKTLPPPSASKPPPPSSIPHVSPGPGPGSSSSRPNTPAARKNLPASVALTAGASSTSTHDRPSPSPSPIPKERDRHGQGAASLLPSADGSSVPALRYPGQPPPVPASSQHPHAQVQPNGSASLPGPGEPALSAEAAAREREARRVRKEEKRNLKKRKLASAAGGAGLLGSSSNPATPQGSPGSMAHRLAPGLARTDSLPPSKMRKLHASPSMESVAGSNAGIKVRLNGFTVNRQSSATPSDFTQSQAPVRKAAAIPGVADDFSLPSRPLVPPPPPLQMPAATPKRQIDVDEDFDHAKPSSQVPYSTFANWVGDYLRSFGEDDLAFLCAKPVEDAHLFVVPPLGPHYLDTWAAIDAETSSSGAGPNGELDLPGPSNALMPPLTKKFRHESLTSEALCTENVFLGPLSERVMSAFRHTDKLPTMLEAMFAQHAEDALNPGKGKDTHAEIQMGVDGGVGQTSPAMPTPAVLGDQDFAASSSAEQDTLDFEGRLMRELAFLGVIPTPPPRPPQLAKKPSGGDGNALSASEVQGAVDWAKREDDDISAALRGCQRLLRQQKAANEARKARLAERVRQRIAYQEYETLRDGLEAVIEAAWNKRQRAAQRKVQKDKKEKDKKDREKDKEKEATATLAQSIAALNMPQALSPSLVSALTKRRNLVDGFASLFSDGLLMPSSSVYADLDLKKNVATHASEAF